LRIAVAYSVAPAGLVPAIHVFVSVLRMDMEPTNKKPMKLSQTVLARAIGVPPRQINEIQVRA
jgi:hypothetical protein